MSASTEPLRVLVAGGGVAGVETLLGLHAFAKERVALTLLTSASELVDRPSSVQVPFGYGRPRSVSLKAVGEHAHARILAGSLGKVMPEAHRVTSEDGQAIDYDVLVIATGAIQHEPLPGALTFRGTESAEDFRLLLRDLHTGRARRVVFAVPTGTSWTLPLYELALGTSARLRALGVATADLTLTTPEETALELFGAAASQQVEELLRDARVDLIVQSHATAVEGGHVVLMPDRRVPADHVVTLPRLAGPAIPGLPHDADGFLETDLHGQVRRVPDVYAAGDVTTFPIKQGGLAAQQADAIAEAIAARAGAPVDPRPFHPVLRGQLLVGRAQRFLEAAIGGGSGDVSRFESLALWWPPVKVAARHLGTYLEGVDSAAEPPRSDEGVQVVTSGSHAG